MTPTFNVENGYITTKLSPFQCASLAKACYIASEQSCDSDIDLWRTLAALFPERGSRPERCRGQADPADRHGDTQIQSVAHLGRILPLHGEVDFKWFLLRVRLGSRHGNQA